MTEYTPKQRRDLAESCISHLGLNDPSSAQALVAIFDLLDERLPEKPMQVIPTDSAPAPMDTIAKPANGGRLSKQFECMINSNDVMTVMKDYAYKAVVFAANDGDESVEIYLSYADARALAEEILRSV